MTNEEKINEILLRFIPNEDYDDGMSAFYAKSALSLMAEWKDKQYSDTRKDLLELVNMLHVDESNQTVIEDLKNLLR